MQHFVGEIFAVKGVLQRGAHVVVAAAVARLVEGDVVHVRRGEGADLVGAGIAEVGVAARVVDDHVDIRVLKGGDDLLGRRVFLEIDHVHRQVVIAVIAVEGQQLRALLVVHVRAAAHRVDVAVRADLDDRNVEQLDKLLVRDAERDDQLAVGIGYALYARKAAGEAVGVDAVLDRHAHVVARDRRAVVEDVRRIIGQRPGLAVLRDGPLADQPRALDDLKVVVDLDQVLVHQRADQLVGVVRGDGGVEAEVAVGVEREHMVRRVALFDIPASRGQGDAPRLVRPAAAGKREYQRQDEKHAQRSFDLSLHSFTSISFSLRTMTDAWLPRCPRV